MQQAVIKTINTSTLSDILCEATVEQTVDTGATIVTNVVHAKLGFLTVIQNALDETALVLVGRQFAELLPM